MTLVVTILGCGSSGGVPRVGSGWGACDPSDPRNRRRRCSILIEREGEGGVTSLLIDTSPDLREQLLDRNVTRLDAALITHEHADHTHGIDDLRPLVIHQRRRIPVYSDAKTAGFLRERFGYCFETPPGSDYPPILDERRLTPPDPVTIEGAGGPLCVTPFDMIHGGTTALGLRIDGFAYASDVSTMPAEAEALLHDLDVLVIDALRHAPHPTHFNVADALDLIGRVRPRRAILTNLHTDLDYATLARDLPDAVEPAYDGMTIRLG